MAIKKKPVNKLKEIEKSLLEQLALKGARQEHFVDLIRDYMGLWEVKNELLTDIRTRGVMFTDVSSVGIEMMKNNPSVKELVAVNKQMLTLLEKLGLNTDNAAGGSEDDDL